MSSLRDMIAGKSKINKTDYLLEQILGQLKTLNRKTGDEYYKEWYPMFFQFYAKGYQLKDPVFGTSKWGFKKIEVGEGDLKFDFDYEFDSLYMYTEYPQYRPGLRLIVNGLVYPEKQLMVSEYANYDKWQEFYAHNYCYLRAYMMGRDQSANPSSHAHSEYPFKMVVKKGWTLGFEFFMTSTSNYWHCCEIMGWKLHKIQKEELKELREL